MVIYAINLCIPEWCYETETRLNGFDVGKKGTTISQVHRTEVDQQYLQVLFPLRADSEPPSLKVIVEKHNKRGADVASLDTD
ncbi:unnamed protein product [Pieris brassicae]|uniref:Uncharacterized protein n=1 Tax=Pieris brassicae TaxID=7116 RepID=A0A9P0TEG2_PIEBR|nr:unnamed protein product [Pieris brassicae]